MKAYYDRAGKELLFKAKNVEEMLLELKIMKNTIIVVVNNEVVNENYKFKTNDKIRILSVVSGG
jgi:sulfur carrier protein ThiS